MLIKCPLCEKLWSAGTSLTWHLRQSHHINTFEEIKQFWISYLRVKPYCFKSRKYRYYINIKRDTLESFDMIECPECRRACVPGFGFTCHLSKKHKIKSIRKIEQFWNNYPELKPYCFRNYYELSYKTELRHPKEIGGTEGIDYVICLACGAELRRFSSRHIKDSCTGEYSNLAEYKEAFPDAYTLCELTSKQQSENASMRRLEVIAKVQKTMIERGHYLPGSNMCKKLSIAQRGENNSHWNGGRAPSRGYNWHQQRNLVLERAGYASELSGNNDVRLEVHHLISVHDMHLKYLEICYPTLYQLCIENTLTFGMFEQRIRLGHKNRKHFKGIPVGSVFPECFYDVMNDLDNLIVLTAREHAEYGDVGSVECMSPTFFTEIRRSNA